MHSYVMSGGRVGARIVDVGCGVSGDAAALEMTFNIILALAGFSLLIFVHELGHFLAAKLIGVKVEAFSLGFGPYIGKKWGETEYRLGLAPFGGYVKLSGENREEGKEYGPRDFMSRGPGQRAFVYVAGAAMNIACAFVAFVVAFGMGVTVTPAVSGGVLP
nr:site-2 protease family protein [Candidatus Brocadiia bacterium]